jgi:cyclophilin family peptidyl-prolyl cis-trans isomerase
MKAIIGMCVSAVLLLAPVGITAEQTGTGQGSRGTAPAPAPAPKPAPAPAPAATPQPSSGPGPIIVFETATKGSFEIETYPKEAPRTVAHIVALVKRNFYNGQRFHRVVPGFVVQWGDPASRDMTKKDLWGRGGSGKPIGVAEINAVHTHKLGAVAMAHAGDPKLADSQMYVALAPLPRLDSGYTVFGQVISGMEVVQKLEVGDVIRRATVK